MLAFDPELADIRFGCGLSPIIAPPVSVAEMIGRLRGPDVMAARYPIENFEAFGARMKESHRLRVIQRNNRGKPKGEAARKERNVLKGTTRQDQIRWLADTMLRRAHTPDGLRERLVYFWADHFTAQGKAGVIKRATSPYIQSAIRPHVTGRFGDMLQAVAKAPLMLHYLDQHNSMGPNSDMGLRRKNKRGLNENLAREMLELHTLGVDGPYTQDDVRQLAELLTGLTYDPQGGFKFRKEFVEPGAETVLGVSYGSDNAQLSDVLAALDDLARHPATALHIARKLAVHFVSDSPDADLVAHLAARFTETDGDLGAVSAALLEHPSSWGMNAPNIKQPIDFVGSAMRALAVAPDALPRDKEARMRALFVVPMALMGQQWQNPVGPDGWPEQDSAWITPQRLAARLQWAMTVPSVLRQPLPDPREFVGHALGGRAPDEVRFAASAAENREVGIALILSSPAFQRM